MANCILLLTVNRFLSSVYCKLLNGSCILQINNLLLTVYYHLYTSPCKPYSANCILLKVYVSLLTIYVAITCVRLVTIIFVVLKASSHITYFIKKWAIPASFSFIFVFSNKQNNFYNKYLHVINVHPVYGAGIWTHDLQNMSLLPWPLDQGSCPKTRYPFSWTNFLASIAIHANIWQSFSVHYSSSARLSLHCSMDDDEAVTDWRKHFLLLSEHLKY